MKVAFYAPMKSPDHETPSGDRLIGRLYLSALQRAGFDIDIASHLRTWEGRGDKHRQDALRDQSLAQADEIIENYRRHGVPDIWFSYHVYHKAPDWIGQIVSKTLRIPYVIAEASYAPKQRNGPWSAGLDHTASCIAQADLVIVQNPIDAECIKPLLRKSLCILPVFIDIDAIDQTSVPTRQEIAQRHDLDLASPWIASVAMMRHGDKLASYALLGEAMETVSELNWQLVVVGDGQARHEVEQRLSTLPREKVRFVGRLEQPSVYSLLRHCAFQFWPGVNEAIGMGLLESLAVGVPVVCGKEGAIPTFVHHRVNGLLVPGRRSESFTAAICQLLSDDTLRRQMGKNARELACRNNSIDSAASHLKAALRALT